MIEVSLRPETLRPPRSSLCVLRIAGGKYATAMADMTRDRVQRLAVRCGADYVELTGDKFPQWPMANKYRIGAVAEQYERTLFLDVDTIVSNLAPNPFEALQVDEFAIYDEIHHGRPPYWATTESLRVAWSQGIELRRLDWAGNSGVMMIPQAAAWVVGPPTAPIVKTHCADQQLFSARLACSGFPVHFLDWKWNCVRNDHRFTKRWPDAYIAHVNGGKGNQRLDSVKWIAKRLS